MVDHRRLCDAPLSTATAMREERREEERQEMRAIVDNSPFPYTTAAVVCHGRYQHPVVVDRLIAFSISVVDHVAAVERPRKMH
jgi:hypothetical protein